MPDPMLLQECSWPGVVAIAALDGTISHGITPSKFILTTYPQATPIASYGDLVIGDGRRRLTLKNCRVARMTAEASGEGQTWTLEIEDRRWAWPGSGAVSGEFNREDKKGKLVPWTIRSPKEMVQLCLDAMGEMNAVVIVPEGIPAAAGKNFDDYLKVGVNLPQSLANPHTVWDHTPPAEALARLVEQWGCAVVYQPIADRILITPMGTGQTLPEGPCEALGGGADNPRIPVFIGAAGAPMRFQMRFILEAVGVDYGEQIVPIDQLSYTPKIGAAAQVSTATYTGTGNPTALIVTITINPGAGNEATFSFTGSSGSVATKLGSIAAQINGRAEVAAVVSVGATGTVVTVTARNSDTPFGLTADSIGIVVPDTFMGALVAAPGPPNGRSWKFCPPPHYHGVEATPQLAYAEARALAAESVYRYYRLAFIDPSTGKPPIKVPWYDGPILRRQQFWLQDTQVEQVIPAPRIPGIGNRNNPAVFALPMLGGFLGALAGGLPDQYQGYSRDKPAVCTGSAYRRIGRDVFWAFDPNLDPWNTKDTDRIWVPFSIDPYRQLVIFAEPVYRIPNLGNGGMIEPASITLETACLVTDAANGNFVRWEEKLPLGGLAPPQWEMHEDIRVGVVADYAGPGANQGAGAAAYGSGGTGNIVAVANMNAGARNRQIGWHFAEGDINDAKGRAKYYLEGAASKIQVPQADSRQYIGLFPLDPDGIIRQVGYSLGPAGVTTFASANTEYSVSIPSAPARRRAENLPPNAAAAIANLVERANAAIPALDPVVPQAGLARFIGMAKGGG